MNWFLKTDGMLPENEKPSSAVRFEKSEITFEKATQRR